MTDFPASTDPVVLLIWGDLPGPALTGLSGAGAAAEVRAMMIFSPDGEGEPAAMGPMPLGS
jgi:hypothetical protein